MPILQPVAQNEGPSAPGLERGNCCLVSERYRAYRRFSYMRQRRSDGDGGGTSRRSTVSAALSHVDTRSFGVVHEGTGRSWHKSRCSVPPCRSEIRSVTQSAGAWSTASTLSDQDFCGPWGIQYEPLPHNRRPADRPQIAARVWREHKAAGLGRHGPKTLS